MQDVPRGKGDFHFRAGGHDDGLTFAFGILQHIGALCGHVLGFMFQTHGRQTLTGQRQHRRCFLGCQCDFPAFGSFHRVGGAEHIGIRCGAGNGQMLNRLVRRAIFAQTDGIVGHHINRRHPHQRGQAHRATGVIGETHESAAIGAHTAMQHHTVHRRRHTVFADAVIDVAPATVINIECAHIAGFGVVRSGQIGRATHSFNHERIDHFQHHFAGFTGGNLGRFFGNLLFQRLDGGRQFLVRVQRIGALEFTLLVAGDGQKAFFPCNALGLAAGADGFPLGLDVLGDGKGGRCPAVGLFGVLDQLGIGQGTVAFGRILRTRPQRDMRLAGDQ